MLSLMLAHHPGDDNERDYAPSRCQRFEEGHEFALSETRPERPVQRRQYDLRGSDAHFTSGTEV